MIRSQLVLFLALTFAVPADAGECTHSCDKRWSKRRQFVQRAACKARCAVARAFDQARVAVKKVVDPIQGAAKKVVSKTKAAFEEARRWLTRRVEEIRRGLRGPRGRPILLAAATADRVLRPGDLLVKFGAKATSITQKVIVGAQRLLKVAYGVVSRSLRMGSANGFHDAIYLGNGLIAEAKQAGIGVSPLADNVGYLFEAYRPKDAALAARAAEVARRWATGRMRYRVPVHVGFRSKKFGSRARRDALLFGAEANREGGPAAVSSMFCSQFVVASYQAAVVRPQLDARPDLAPEQIRMPWALRIHAENTSPLGVHGRLRQAVYDGRDAWVRAALFLVRQ